MSFESLSLSPEIAGNVKALGYTVPTPIQRNVIPAIMAGRDVIGLAQTGTGKTAAFAIPLLQRLLSGPRHQLRALIVGPTRELAEQTRGAIEGLGAGTRLRCVTLYGGVGMQPQVSALRAGAEIAIACPGRLLDHARQGTIRLDRVECLVLDEADRMFDMGFLPDIRRIVAKLPASRQTLLFSATMPDEIRTLAHGILRDPVTVQIAHARPASTVSHAVYPVTQHLKTPLLLALLERTDRDAVLVFTHTKHRAKRLAARLEASGHPATSLQGNLSQNRRKAALDGFRSGRYRVMVATDLAARGIDVSTISHVINYDMPRTVDDYTHRIGRTGRAAKTGDAFTFVTHEDEGLVRGIERVLGARIERRRLDGFDYGAKPAAEPERHPGSAPRGADRPPRSGHRPHGHAAHPAAPTHSPARPQGPRRRRRSFGGFHSGR